MHEAGIAASILEIAVKAAEERGYRPVLRIRLQLGELAGVAREALEFAFDVLRQDTLAAGAILEIATVPLTGECSGCGWTGEPPERYAMVCPRCAQPATIVSGREMLVEYVDLDDSEDGGKGEGGNGTSQCGSQSSESERAVRRDEPALV